MKTLYWLCKLSHTSFSSGLFSSVAQRPHELQHARPPCPSQTPGVYSNSCPSSWWCHPTITSSVVPFSSCPQSLQASGSFPMSQLCMRWPMYWSFSFNISPSNEHPALISFRMDWLDILAVQGTLESLLQHRSSKASIFQHSAFSYMLTKSYSSKTSRTPFPPLHLLLSFWISFELAWDITKSKYLPEIHFNASVLTLFTTKLFYSHISTVSLKLGGGIRLGNTCKSMADSCQCMAKATTVKKKKKKNEIILKLKKKFILHLLECKHCESRKCFYNFSTLSSVSKMRPFQNYSKLFIN